MKNNKKYIFIILIFITSIVLVFCFIFNPKNHEDYLKTNITIDKYSGETIIETPNKSPEKAGADNSVVFLGYSKLIDIGMTYNQMIETKKMFNNYAESQKNISISEISINISSIISYLDDTTSNRIITFETIINRKTKINAKIEYFGTGNPSLILYDKNNTVIYSS